MMLGIASQVGKAAFRAAKGTKLPFGQPPRRRRRRARLTQGELMELQQIKAILGKTAAANALPYYMGRGR